MKVEYKGHEIEVKRERCMAGWMLLYYSIFRLGDGYEVTSGFTEDQSSVKEYVGYMKKKIDDELAEGKCAAFSATPDRKQPQKTGEPKKQPSAPQKPRA